MFARRYENCNAHQQQVVEDACTAMAAMAERAIFMPSNMALWFGAGQNGVVTPKLRQMAAVIADPNRTVTFVNRTGGVMKVEHTDVYTKTLMPVPAAGTASVEGVNHNSLGGSGVIAYAHPVDRRDEPGPKRTTSHVGSGMRLYLNDAFFTLDANERAATLYHEMTHKVLATNDHAYDAAACQALAANSPALAAENADNFGLFVAQC